MNETILFRSARLEDLDALVELLAELFSIEEDFTFNAELQRRGLLLLLGNPFARVVVAENGDRAVGMVSGQLVVSTAEGGPAVLVEDVVVSACFRQRGIGRRLLDEIAAWAAAKGAGRLQLLADRNNGAALAFYEKTGWQFTSLICLRQRPASQTGHAGCKGKKT